MVVDWGEPCPGLGGVAVELVAVESTVVESSGLRSTSTPPVSTTSPMTVTVGCSAASRKAPAAGSGDAAREKYHGQLAAFHRISVGAMKAAQDLDPAATDELLAAIDVIAPWYPAEKGAGAAITPEDHLALEEAGDVWRSRPGG